MTNNEIIKALKCCNSPFSEHRCEDCPMQGNFRCSYYAINIAIDLINRQKAEIEELEKSLLKEKLRNNMLYEVGNEIKSVTIKEFAERLKEKLQWDVELDNKLVFESDIDNIAKEMMEELKNDDTKNNISTFDGNRSIR